MIQKTQIKHALNRLDLDETLNRISNVHAVIEAMEVMKLEDDDPEIRDKYLSSWASILSNYLEGIEKITNQHFKIINHIEKIIDEEL